MKNRKLTLALATVAILGAASLSMGSVMLARIAAPAEVTATEADRAVVPQKPLPEQPDRQAARHGTTVAKVSDPDMVPTMVSSQSGDSRVVDHGGAIMAVAEQPGTAHLAAASGTSTSGQAGSIPGASGRSVEPGAMAGPSAAMSRPATAPVAQAGGSSASATGARGPAATQSDSSASPGTSKGSSPTEAAKTASSSPTEAAKTASSSPTEAAKTASSSPIEAAKPASSSPIEAAKPASSSPIEVAKAASPSPTEVAHPALPDPIEIAKAALPDPIEIIKEALPDLTDRNPVILPAQDLNVPSGGAVKDVPTEAAQTVSEPSTLALIGIAALGLMARRRIKRGS